MSCAVDSNIWIYAFDDASPRHRQARAFLHGLLEQDDPLVMTWPIVYEVLRVLTHPAIVGKRVAAPVVEKELFRFIDAAALRILPETENHREFLSMVLRDTKGAKGNFWHDCHIAATLLEHGTNVLYSCDRDFRRISLLKVIDPLT